MSEDYIGNGIVDVNAHDVLSGRYVYFISLKIGTDMEAFWSPRPSSVEKRLKKMSSFLCFSLKATQKW